MSKKAKPPKPRNPMALELAMNGLYCSKVHKKKKGKRAYDRVAGKRVSDPNFFSRQPIATYV